MRHIGRDRRDYADQDNESNARRVTLKPRTTEKKNDRKQLNQFGQKFDRQPAKPLNRTGTGGIIHQDARGIARDLFGQLFRHGFACRRRRI